ncbi:glycosyltransferase family 2 protein [Roseburia inulinivorans]
MDQLSIIVPCYNEEQTVELFYTEVQKVVEQMPDIQTEYLFVDDGSTDRTLEKIKELHTRDKRVKYISFSRNFGKEAAMYAGLEHASGKYAVIMDADLQDPPMLLPEMLRTIREEQYDSVATRRVTRKGEPPIRSFCARQFYHIMNKISDVELMDGARDYRFMTRKYVNAVLSLKEYNRFSKGIFGWVGFRTKWLEFENQERSAGETKWSFWKLVQYSLQGIVSFSETPLYIASVLGGGMCGVALLAIIFIIVRQLLFGGSAFGWPSMACIVILIGGIQLLSIGILGLYFSKMYLEIKHRPIYIMSETCIDLERKEEIDKEVNYEKNIGNRM